MRILVDENVPGPTVRALRSAGHDVADVRGTPDEGMDDPALWRKAQREGRLLITTDRGFTRRREEPHHGILVVRVRQPDMAKIHSRVMQAVADFEPDEWPGVLVVMRDNVRSVSRGPAARE